MMKLIPNYRSQAQMFIKWVIMYYALRVMRVASSKLHNRAKKRVKT